MKARRKYSRDEMHLIVAGLTSGRRPGLRPMSDAEWRARFDPESVYKEKLLACLDKIADGLAEQAAPPAKYPEPRLAPAPQTRGNGGAIDL